MNILAVFYNCPLNWMIPNDLEEQLYDTHTGYLCYMVFYGIYDQAWYKHRLINLWYNPSTYSKHQTNEWRIRLLFGFNSFEIQGVTFDYKYQICDAYYKSKQKKCPKTVIATEN